MTTPSSPARNAGVVLLRGVNVGGHRKLPMATLRALLTGLGLRDVQTYVQSGNAVFSLPDGSELDAAACRALADRIAAAIAGACGFEAAVVVRANADWQALVAGNPFADEPDLTHVHALILDGDVDADDVDALAERWAELPERIAAGPGARVGVVYLHTPDGLGRAKLTPDRVERGLGVAATQRNWRSVLALAALLEGASP